MNTNGLKTRLNKLEAKQQPKKKIFVFVESQENLEEKRRQEEPGREYVYFRWDWGDKEIEI